ncbi:MAG TPA: aminotransferase class III [Candidatus Omnitrophica bacterium]|nr:MAG: aminotransferase class III [Omnitrophica WOR_2 bacterium GWA2_45_18]HBR15978.1 aminotransferase class III [Candidatus Omnitrophota bacterium]
MAHYCHETTNKGAALWEKAKRLIPGGNQLLSKRAEMFLPGRWPAYYQKAKGVDIWDMEMTKYVDMSIMGIGSCVLGYANDEMEKVVKAAVEQGNMSTLNCYEEVALAQKLIELHPWAEMARFAKTGGEINAVAIRIARAYTKKDKVAFCGYHGWSDWYLAANLADGDNLDGQLLPGLEPAGVPRALTGTAMPFNYGKIEELKQIVTKNKDEVGVIIMEVTRYTAPDLNFLREVRQIAEEIGAVLIFDEISSGFRANTGGMHLLYDIRPDMMTLGKALGAGYPITAVIGKGKIMQAAQDTFISSTYWTERIGFVAGLETIRQYETYHVADHLVEMGNYAHEGLEKIFRSNDLKISVVGMPAVPVIAIKEENPLEIKTVITQEMLKRFYLASNIIYISSAHTREIIDGYLKNMAEVFEHIIPAIKSGRVATLLESPVCHGGFKRLN